MEKSKKYQISQMFAKFALGAAAAITLSSCGQSGSDGDNKVNAEYLASGGDGSNWAMTGFSYDEQRHSPLDQINDSNVDQLGIEWFADLPDARGQEATPVVVDGKMYITTAWSKVFAYDAATGEALWNYDPEVPKETGAKACCDVVNRGLAYWKGKLFVGTLDGRLVSLDANSGDELWSVQTLDPESNGTITGVPRVFKDMVIIGNGGAEFGVRGYVTAYDVDSGDKKWRFYTVPNPKGEADGEASDAILAKAYGTWSGDDKAQKGDWRESGGGGTVWDTIVYDHELDQLYIGVGNGNPWNHGTRSAGEGDNWFLSSIVALNPDTGEYIWHYQETPAETWDFTATQPIILANQTVDGKERKVLYHAPKNGFFFTIDRTTGVPIAAETFIDGVNWATGYDKETWRPNENPAARFYKTGEPFLAIPSALGAHNWHPMSYNPTTGLVYIPAQTIAAAYLPATTVLDKERKKIGFNVGVSNAGFSLPDDVNFVRAAIAATTGSLVAFDPRTGKKAWSIEQETPWNGGTLTTAGNLVFQGNALGEFNAYAADKGTKLFTLPVQSGVLAGASTYSVNSEQYVAFLTSKGGAFPLVAGYAGGAANPIPSIPRLIVLKLGAKGELPALPDPVKYEWNAPDQFGDAAQIADGEQSFLRYCMVCHGAGAVGGGVVPDLRKSGTIADKDSWKSIVYDGILKDRGMVGFSSVMDEAQSENIRAYVIGRTEQAKKDDAAITAK